ncbi:wall-associated receptor kinase-like 4 isoform X1 [Salvia miltiorrhiza]|uniref:wall-associated receptor kinase-like 4 isoform X1 n=1 Tax=Salvia miltiorrhiza TaxID=226208 RepID=UPI0025ACD328|nr:wall-associated receptor kinase-like 4 isoform X1 [Salvia miltiorrhiza]XP_057795627.1 wall-associated receptor kinase-like 4 isoform X1 [Salvia miltiorrhiza]
MKLLGCCLETQIPLLVYEFVPYKTLLDHINAECLARSLSWDIRCRYCWSTRLFAFRYNRSNHPWKPQQFQHIAGPCLYCQSECFSLTCSQCFCVGFSGNVTSSCLNADYVSSGEFIEKSDVCSYGLILAELLTGKSVMSPEWLQGEENLAKYFVGPNRGGELLGILDDRLVTDDDNLCHLTQVAEIAKRCLSSSYQERPTIKEVSIALECLIFRDHRLSLN